MYRDGNRDRVRDSLIEIEIEIYMGERGMKDSGREGQGVEKKKNYIMYMWP